MAPRGSISGDQPIFFFKKDLTLLLKQAILKGLVFFTITYTSLRNETGQLGDSCVRILIYHSLDLEYF